MGATLDLEGTGRSNHAGSPGIPVDLLRNRGTGKWAFGLRPLTPVPLDDVCAYILTPSNPTFTTSAGSVPK